MSDDISVRITSIVWLDSPNNLSSETDAVTKQLSLVDKNLKTFDNIIPCEEHIRSQSNDARITLIVSGRLGQQLVPNIHSLPQIIEIYVYCMDKQTHEQWAKQYAKVKGVFIDFAILYTHLQIKPILHKVHHSIIAKTFSPAELDTDEVTANGKEIEAFLSDVSQTKLLTTTVSQKDPHTTLPSEVAVSSPATLTTNMATASTSQADLSATTSSDTQEVAATVSPTALHADTPSDIDASSTTISNTELPAGTPSQAATVETTVSQTETISNPYSYELDSSFMISNSCVHYLVRMKSSQRQVDDFISFCQSAIQGQNDELIDIFRECHQSYSADRAIEWLYRHPFFYEFLDNMFSFTFADGMFSSRAFIHDIHKQLEQHICTSAIRVYRYEQMSNEKYQHLTTLKGKIVAMKYFFLTNSNRETALSAKSVVDATNEDKHILFIVDADPQIQKVKLFASIGSLSKFNDPNDVLFMIGSLFKIMEIQEETDGIIVIRMTLCGNDDENETKKVFDQIISRYVDSNGETDVIGYGQLLFDIGNLVDNEFISQTGKEIIQSYLSKLPDDHADCLRCYDVLGHINYLKGNIDSALDWGKKSLEIKKSILPANDSQLAECYKMMAELHLHKRECPLAREYFSQVVTIWKELYGDDYKDLALCYINIAYIFDEEAKFLDALSYYTQAEIILLKHNAGDEIHFATLCNNLGKVRCSLKHYHLALGYCELSLAIKSKIFPPTDSSIAIGYKNIGLIHRYMGSIEQSRAKFEKAAEIYRQMESPDNKSVAEIEELISNLSNESN